MRNSLFVLCLMILSAMTTFARAEETAPPEVAPSIEAAAPVEPVPAPPVEPVAVPPVEAIPAPPVETAPVVAAPAAEIVTDNLEFISGEVSAMDEAAKSVSVRLYGEDETASSEKVLQVTVDENTDITDGEQDRDLKSLTVGTEVDVEYDPASNKATYIFVY